MSASITNRIFLPDGKKIYVTDDQYGDERLIELHQKYGNLKMQSCHKEFGKTLDQLKSFWTGTIEKFFS